MALGANYYSGTLGKVNYVVAASGSGSGTQQIELPTKTWNGTHSVAALDSTNTMSAGFQNITPGIHKFEGSATLVWDGAGTTDIPPEIVAGSYMHIQMWPNRALTNPIDIPSAYIKSVKYNDPVEQLLTIDVEFESDGSFTMPNGQ